MKETKHIFGETFSPEPPRPSREVYEIVSTHVGFSEAGEEKQETHDLLNDVFKAIGGQEWKAELVLDKWERGGKIRREDSLVILVILASSRTLGPDLDFLRQALVNGRITDNEIKSLKGLGLSKNIVDYLYTILETLKI